MITSDERVDFGTSTPLKGPAFESTPFRASSNWFEHHNRIDCTGSHRRESTKARSHAVLDIVSIKSMLATVREHVIERFTLEKILWSVERFQD